MREPVKCVVGLLGIMGVSASAWGAAWPQAVRFSDRDGSLTSPWVGSGESGLWCVRFDDNSTLDAAAFSNGNGRHFAMREADGSRFLTYTSSELDVTIRVTPAESGLDLQADLHPHAKTLLDFDCPARLRFNPDDLGRMVFPQDGNLGLGMALNDSFFRARPGEAYAGWHVQAFHPALYTGTLGCAIQMRDLADPPVRLQVTETGRAFLSESVQRRLAGAEAVVNRAPKPGPSDCVIVDSPNGPYLSGTSFGGKGRLWRIGACVTGERNAAISQLAVTDLARYLSESPGHRPKIACIVLPKAPERGIWSDVACRAWETALRGLARADCRMETLDSLPAIQAALASDAYELILNPYGEGFPVEARDQAETMARAVKAYVAAGGNWMEVGGFPFLQTIVPDRYYTLQVNYPPAFSDFVHLSCKSGGTVAVYGIQPRPDHEPWHAETLFVPGALACGGDPQGGYFGHRFATYVRGGETWRSPVVRIAFSRPYPDALRDYADANGLNRPLAAKIKPDLLERFKAAPLLKLSGPCRAMMAIAEQIPAPSIIHNAEYLMGGFDKQLPDHLPPNASFGTMEEMGEWFVLARKAGHLIAPYTNPTWWCDQPKGPTFVASGDAPLLRTLKGETHHEQYGPNGGWTTTLWHPAVQAANRKTVRQFTQDYPVDLLFQDQCGARSWLYDMNPASPTPYAYTEGMLAMNEEDSRRVPLGTESGWDRVANEQTMLCGMTWSIVPTRNPPAWRQALKQRFAPETWTIEPLSLRLMHDKVLLTHHDLGQFVEDPRSLVWTFALGYGMSYVAHASHWLDNPERRAWYGWLSRCQKSVVARYAGTPVRTFTHDRSPLFAARSKDPATWDDDGVILATYGTVRIIANLGNTTRTVDGHRLAPFGYWIEAPGLLATRLDGEPYIIRDNGQEWRYPER